MRRAILFGLLLAACGEPEPRREPTADAEGLVLVEADPSDAPIATLTDRELARFAEGDARFELPFREPQGLGPLYIHRSCATCHEDDARGPGAVRRLAVIGEGAPLPFGDALRPRLAAGARTPIAKPDRDDVRESVRLGPAVFGRGYLDAIDDAQILAWETAQASRDDGISGRAHRLPSGELGRFGLKARLATLEEFVADAFLGDMGLTSPLRPTELPNPDGLSDDARAGVDLTREEVALVADYVRMLAIPRRAEVTGAALFDAVRCSVCHVPSARTRADAPITERSGVTVGRHLLPSAGVGLPSRSGATNVIAALRDVPVALYTDLLLHDMGEGLADGVSEGDASGREWRTAPLIGVRHLRGLLHDGRADSVREAIEAHASEGSEANDSVERFRALAAADQDVIVAFVEAL